MVEKQTKDIQKIVDVLLEKYQKAIDNKSIKSPLAYALYKTWRYVDSGKYESEDNNG